MRFSVNINMDGAEATDAPNVLLLRTFSRISRNVAEGVVGGNIMDINGNTVGHWGWESEPGD